MTIEHCTIEDAGRVLRLYEFARQLQREKKMVVWPGFDQSFIENEVREQRQWKLVVNGGIACNWAITYADREIWEEMDRNNAIYIHRIATDPDFRGNRFIDVITAWARQHAAEKGRQFVRLDTLGNNVKLIQHYTSAGYKFLGMHRLTNTATLPLHYQNEPNCCRFEIDLKTAML